MARRGRPTIALTWTPKTRRLNPRTGEEARYGSFVKIHKGKKFVLASCWEDEQKDRRKVALARWDELQDQLKLSPNSIQKGKQKLRDVVHRYLESLNGKSEGHQYNLARVFDKYLCPMFGTANCEDVDTEFLLDIRANLERMIAKGTLTAHRANFILKYAIIFTHFLYGREYIATVPRILTVRKEREKLTFAVPIVEKNIRTIEPEHFRELYLTATPQMKVFMEMAWFTGFYAVDISELTHQQIDWEESFIRHKRVKTRQHKDVPTVEYCIPYLEGLFDLINGWRPFMTVKEPKGANRCFLNRHGEVLTLSGFDKETGKGRRKNCIGTQFSRLCKKIGVNYSFGDIRNTSATLLFNKPEFSHAAEHFLGHAPQTISGRHYTAITRETMMGVGNYLGSQFVEFVYPTGVSEDDRP